MRDEIGPAEVELASLAPFTVVAGDTVVGSPVTGDCVAVEEPVWSVREQGSPSGERDLDVAAARSAGEAEPCSQTRSRPSSPSRLPRPTRSYRLDTSVEVV